MKNTNKNNNTFENQLFSITTIIDASYTKDGRIFKSQGSGFYYTQMTPADSNKQGLQWHKVEKHWLVTNRHVVLAKIDDTECVPDEFTFCIRENIDGKIEWKRITLDKKQLLASLKLHKQSDIDVAVIDVSTQMSEIIHPIADGSSEQKIYLPTSLSNLNLPENQPMTIDVTSDIIVASYPNGFYDTTNKFPIVKSGIIASAWGANFRGEPMFQIDAQLFPGSSGGLVISKPTNILMIDGSPHYSSRKEFVLLGVYSGEFRWYEEIDIGGKKIQMGNSYGLGNVWYSYLILQIIDDGISYE